MVAIAIVLTAATVAVAARPNVILVISDDHGWPNYGFQESPLILSNG